MHEVFPNQTGYYLTVGYKFGYLMPFVTAGNADADPFTGALTQGVFRPNPAIAQSSLSIGTGYEVIEYSAIKIEAKKVDPNLYAVQMNIPGMGTFGPQIHHPGE